MRNADISIQLELPPELESQLSAEALRLNLPLSEYILRVLSIGQVLSNPPKTKAELVACWQSKGVINSRLDSTALCTLTATRSFQRPEPTVISKNDLK